MSLCLPWIAHVELDVDVMRQSLIVRLPTELRERLGQSPLLGCPILNENCTASADVLLI
jgi:hypothetical protein